MWFRDIFLNPDERAFADGARRVFDQVCSQEGMAAAEVYAAHPQVRAETWEDIRKEVIAFARVEGRERALAVRGRLAEQIELLSTAHFYTNLAEADRDVWARQVLSSTRQQQDEVYYFAMAYNYSFATVLESIFFLGWTGDEDAKETLKNVERNFMDDCRQHCELVFKIAHAREMGIELGDDEKERGKSIVLMKELNRRALAGEKLDES